MEQPEQDYASILLILQGRIVRDLHRISIKNDPELNRELLKNCQKNLDFLANICAFYIPEQVYSSLYVKAVKEIPGEPIQDILDLKRENPVQLSLLI